MKWKTDEGEYGNGCLKKVNEFVLNELIMIEMPKPYPIYSKRSYCL